MKKKLLSAVAASLSVALISAVIVSTASYAGAAETSAAQAGTNHCVDPSIYSYPDYYNVTYPPTYPQAPTFPQAPEQPFEYTVQPDGTAMITEYKGQDRNVVIPEQIDGHTVTALGGHAIYYFVPCGTVLIEWEMTYGESYPIYYMDSVTIPPTITEMGYEAVGCYKDGVEMRYHKIDNFTIYGKKYSRAYFYAIDNGFKFVETEDDQGSTNHCTEQDSQPYSYPDYQGSTNHCTEQDSQPYSYPDNQGSTNHCTEFDYSYPYTVAATGTALPGLLGDVTGDGKLAIDDATQIQFKLAQYFTFTPEQERLADYDGDNTVSIKDVTRIQYKLADLA